MTGGYPEKTDLNSNFDYEEIDSLVCRLVMETRKSQDLSSEEELNLKTFVRYRAAPVHDRSSFQSDNFVVHRRGIVHLPVWAGDPAAKLDHAALEGRENIIKDVIAKGDRVWCIFTVRARHVGLLYGVPGTGKIIEMTEVSVMRFERGKIAECWFIADELSLCNQLGIGLSQPLQ
ncbi:ester cyclase [Roseibium sp. M-1]